MSPIEILRNFVLSSERINEVPNTLSINKMHGDAPIKIPEVNANMKLTAIQFL
jgi:hypothetical protein